MGFVERFSDSHLVLSQLQIYQNFELEKHLANVGIDFAGPLYVKEKGGSMCKCYITVFSCCFTRAVHLELVPDLSTTAFLNGLRRFAARKGYTTTYFV